MVRSTLQKRTASALLLTTIAVQLHVSGALSALQNTPVFRPFIGVPAAEAQTTGFYDEGAMPKYGKTWIASITCRDSNGATTTIGGTGNPEVVKNAVRQAIANRGLGLTPPNNPIVRTDGGTGAGFNWNDNSGTPALNDLNAVCQILGYPTYISSTCRDEERSGIYPNGKCNFHSPEDNQLSRLSGTFTTSACSDGVDNDGDGRVDFPSDPGCVNAQDTDEADPTNNARCLSIITPNVINVGQQFQATVTMQNNGGTTWSTSNYKLSSENPMDNLTWGINRVDLPQNTAVNGSATFTFTATAPSTQGTYNFDFGMVQTNLGHFGEICRKSLTLTPVQCPSSTVNATFEGNQGPWEDVAPNGDAKAPTFVGNVQPGTVMKVNSVNGTYSARIYGGVDQLPVSCDNGTLSFTGNSNSTISSIKLNAIGSNGVTVPNGATRAFVSHDEPGSFNYFDNSGNRDHRAPCQVNFGIVPTSCQQPQCRDGLDNDGDGLTDFPADPGCINQDDNDESPRNIGNLDVEKVLDGQIVPGQTAQYTITVRNNGNVAAQNVNVYDYFLDDQDLKYVPFTYVSSAGVNCSYQSGLQQVSCPVGTVAAGSTVTITLRFNVPQTQSCNTQVKNRVDAWINGQQAGADTDDVSSGVQCPFQCSDGRDNDGDGLTDFPQDPGCVNAQDNDEFNAPQCQDGIDNDQDGVTDYPNDFSCSSPTDNDETNPKAACQDGLDNDNDGRVDFPQDVGCVNNQDNDETDPYTFLYVYKTGPVDATRGSNIPYTINVRNNGASIAQNVVVQDIFPTGLSFVAAQSTAGCTAGPNTITCNVGAIQPGQDKELTLVFTATTTVACEGIVQNRAQATASNVQGTSVGNQWSTTIHCTAQCQDGIDNDGDGATDYPNDFSCSSPTDTDETNPKAACQDGVDNDGDGLTDFPQDPGCVSKQDNDESNASQCNDGIDNDGDGATDYPNDFSCSSPTDTDETNPKAACQDGFDNDFDGKVDFPQDPGCASKQDNDEFNAPLPACQDGIDNDGDGRVDLQDPGCSGPTDTNEGDEAQCQDLRDNDGDGLTDFPFDPGCASPSDNDEFNQTQTVDVQITKTGPASVVRGQTLVYTIQVGNAGNAQATNVTVVDQIPAGVTFNDNASYFPCQQQGNQVSCPIGTLPAGVFGSFQISFDVPTVPNCVQGQTQPIVNTATITATEDSATTGNNASSTANAPARVDCPASPQCSDGIDNDADGATDFPNDFSCSSPTDTDETNPKAACQDGFDNDFDGLTDFPLDPGCASKQDNDEANAPATQCTDGIDNDGDGRIDTQDAGCANPTDNNEGDGAADLGVTLNGPSTVQGGTNATYIATISNNGPDAVTTPATIRIAIPNGVTFNPNSSSPGCVQNGNAVVCSGITLGTTFPNNQTQRTISFSVPGNQLGSRGTNLIDIAFGVETAQAQAVGVCNTTIVVTVTIPQNANPDPNQTNNTATVSTFVSCQQFQCSDGIDNDGDGRTDFPSDPGCTSAQDNNEGDEAACQDRRDNDGDGLVDWPLDPGCVSPTDTDEFNAPLPACSDGQDNDHDGRIDMLDPGCSNPQDTNEGDDPACSDRIDNDNDGLVDWPLDPGCVGPTDTDETNALPQCSDGLDNDFDGKVDMLDPGCSSPQDNNEGDDPVQSGCVEITKQTFDPHGTALPVTAQFTFILDATRVAYNDSTGRARFDNVLAGTHTVAEIIPSGWTQLSITPANGLVTVAPGQTCAQITFRNRQVFVANAQCNDGYDNDGDGLVDYPQDTGCSSATDNDEYNSTFVPQCRDGIDNDGDGLSDYPLDPGCANQDDNNEQNQSVTPACSDNLDNDGDGLKDYPADPGCANALDTDETNAAGSYACNDNVDNDGDGVKDFPQDPGCSSATDNDEFNFRVPRCSDGIDNDGDGLKDYPQDTGCTTPYDDNEYNDRLWLDRWREWWNWNW